MFRDLAHRPVSGFAQCRELRDSHPDRYDLSPLAPGRDPLATRRTLVRPRDVSARDGRHRRSVEAPPRVDPRPAPRALEPRVRFRAPRVSKFDDLARPRLSAVEDAKFPREAITLRSKFSRREQDMGMNVATVSARLRGMHHPHRDRVILVCELLRHLLDEFRKLFGRKLVRQRKLDIAQDRRVLSPLRALDCVDERLLVTSDRRSLFHCPGPGDSRTHLASARTPAGPVIVFLTGARANESLPRAIGPGSRDRVSTTPGMGTNGDARDGHVDALPDA